LNFPSFSTSGRDVAKTTSARVANDFTISATFLPSTVLKPDHSSVQ
jgi:hypothetical protein